VAARAGAPLSQIHYPFGSKRTLVLALFEHLNAELLERQSRMYGQDAPLWKRWDQACDFLDEDLKSGYVRVLQELIAAAYTDDEIAKRVRLELGGWARLLAQVAKEAEARFGSLGPFSADETSALVGAIFLGAEQAKLLGFTEAEIPTTTALRRFGHLIRDFEERL
jgi:AcrR family transcriptional regulator